MPVNGFIRREFTYFREKAEKEIGAAALITLISWPADDTIALYHKLGEFIRMSIIMAVGNRHHLILASDGRVSDTDANGNHIVLDENFKKIFRLSRSVCVLIAGDRNQCMQIVHILQGNMLASTMPQLCMEAICDIFKNRMIIAENELNVRLIVAGINFLHERELYLFSADQDGINKEKIWLNDAVSYVAKGDIQEGETDYFFPILNENSRDIRTNMKLCIAEAAKRNKSVNDVVFFEEL